MIKRISKVFLFSLIFLILSTVNVAAIDFSADEDYYYELCSTTGLSASDKNTCREFQKYLIDKANAANDELESIQNDLNDIRANIQSYMEEMAKYQSQINSLQADIDRLNVSIGEISRNIEVLANRIAIREADIEAKRLEIADRMVNLQGNNSFSGYIDFLFGANNFSDFIKRAEAIDDITSYNRDQILALQEEIRLLNLDKDDLQIQKELMEEQKTIVETNIASLKVLQERVEIIVIEYRKREAEFMELQDNTVANLDDINNALDNVSSAINEIAPSQGWSYPVRSRFYVSAGVWFYSSSFGGGVHIGSDFAAGIGTPIYSPANGMVLYVSDSCNTYGYYCSRCGKPGASGGGNQVGTIVQVGNSVYFLINFHMQSGVSSITKVGDIVQQGELIGYMGTSGCSTGSHLHQQIIYLGENNMSAMVDKFKRTGDISFGMGWGYSAYNNRCTRIGGSPCYVNPQDIYNVKVGYSYN
ncbi:MAG: murein hydrolase activator EnvC family protein [Erysipelotrichaceae bacterium]